MTRREIWAIEILFLITRYLLPEGKHREELVKITSDFHLYANKEG